MIEEETVKKIREMGRGGISVSSIARECGLSRLTVRRYLSDEGDQSTSLDDKGNEINHHHSSLSRRDRKLSLRTGSGPLTQSLRDELEASKISFELEKLEAEKKKWEERRDRERKEKIEAEGIQRLREFQTTEQERREEERLARIRNKKQQIKNEIFSDTWVDLLSPQLRGRLIIEIERLLSLVDVETLPGNELFAIAEGAAEQVKQEAQRERDRISKERQDRQNKEMQEVAETILGAVRLGAGLPESQ